VERGGRVEGFGVGVLVVCGVGSEARELHDSGDVVGAQVDEGGDDG
jgi:hypothetical protein